ncbi:uncharacterized protein EMH_0044800 [Eimeria mitis]|uniref:SAG family member n=1 Tax=Eimeria mitis TaxID=44415 RepID=U6JU21_9EIME|nr:uncharacterized protein EMH_0044800 [Eimeria mitis]CDJ28884.1 hypothetical protein EMH_0044800 [Eimeria mitis]
MAPLYRTAAAFWLAGLFGLQSVAAAGTKYRFELVEVKEDAYLIAKLARNGKITAKTNTVEKDTDLLAALKGKIKTDSDAAEATCSTLVTEDLKKVFHVTFEYTESPDYPKLVEDTLKAGLADFEETYPADTEAWKKVWKKTNAPGVLHLLEATSTKIACVIANCVQSPAVDTYAKSKQETKTTALLFCELSPAATEERPVFSEEYFKELIARKDELSSMTEDDLTSSANVAVPSILTAGLVAILAAISA